MSVEERLAILEQEMAELKRTGRATPTKENWIDKVAGSFEGDPEFDEILRLGKEIRQADRPRDEDA
jgi:hypothetical protein